MDRLLFGDNQFFGVNHMSEERARAQAMRFQSLDAVVDVLDSAYDEGIRSFMCTTHDRISAVCDHVRADPDRYREFSFLPCMPYAHKYANAVTENGMLGAIRRFLPDEGMLDATIRGGTSVAKRGHRGHHDAPDRRRDEDVRRAPNPGRLPPEHRRRPAARARVRASVSGLRRARRATATTPSRASSR